MGGTVRDTKSLKVSEAVKNTVAFAATEQLSEPLGQLLRAWAHQAERCVAAAKGVTDVGYFGRCTEPKVVRQKPGPMKKYQTESAFADHELNWWTRAKRRLRDWLSMGQKAESGKPVSEKAIHEMTKYIKELGSTMPKGVTIHEPG